MKRKDLVLRVNQRLDGRFYNWDSMKFEFDDAISEVNAKMQTIFPKPSDIMLQEDSTYSHYILTLESKGNIKVTFKTREDMQDYIRENTLESDRYNTRKLDIIPEQYVRTVLVPFVVMRLLQREDEYGNLQSTMNQEFMTGISNLFADYYEKVPEYYIAEDGDMYTYSKHGHDNPYQLKEDYKKGPLD